MGNVRRWRQSATTPSTKWGGAYGQPQQPRAWIGQRTTRADAAGKIRRMATSDGSDRTCTRRLSVYTLCNVVNKCIKNNQSYDEHSSHNTLPITYTSGDRDGDGVRVTTPTIYTQLIGRRHVSNIIKRSAVVAAFIVLMHWCEVDNAGHRVDVNPRVAP